MDGPKPLPEGILSLLDTDLYKLTMQCAVLKYFPQEEVSYSFTNRTPQMKFSRVAFKWLQDQITKLGNILVSKEELEWLKTACPYLSPSYLNFLSTFRLRPAQQLVVSFDPEADTGSDEDVGPVHISVNGLWVDTILFEIPLLALTSEAYFRFCDKDWNHEGQEDKGYRKGAILLENGCAFSEFGTRRRRDYHTQDLVIRGLRRAAADGKEKGWKGTLAGTSNVHFAHKHGLVPIGTVAHEWFMGIAAITNNYEAASETALRYWVGCFGEGVLGIALTDTFGTPAFLKAFQRRVPTLTSAAAGDLASLPSAAPVSTTGDLSTTKEPLDASRVDGTDGRAEPKSYAQIFKGVRQDSGDPSEFVKVMREFYDREGIKETKAMVFSDSLNIELCLKYKLEAEAAGFSPSFGVGTFFTNDFSSASSGQKSVPLNIVIKLSSAANRPAIKISDNIGKNTGDKDIVKSVKKALGYEEKSWAEGDESRRWGTGARS
ncbi:MAG: hypothetical protein M4579_004242 [Chaenotheca gracillima]|nr:MAG: hypothetical protein M4579_004242 [Chaenotheca gracillima]